MRFPRARSKSSRLLLLALSPPLVSVVPDGADAQGPLPDPPRHFVVESAVLREERSFLVSAPDSASPRSLRRYPDASGPRTIVGHSLGGLLGAIALLTRPETFESYVLVSPALWWGFEVALEGISPGRFSELPEGTRVFVSVANESGDLPGGVWGFAHLIERADPKPFAWRLARYPNESHGSVSLRAMYDGLEWLYSQAGPGN
ncbi:MAG: alpha/beta hydrolase-fold protein [Gemmatimonadota bacterium]|nr:alpha/beta hydrolase-fold protein [Gemmatimonadota bacterium]